MRERNKKLSMLDEEIAYEQAIENLDELRTRLHQGSRESGITLTANECYLLAHHIMTPSRPKGRPSGDPLRSFTIAMYCFRHEDAGETLKMAVEATMKQFGISRSAVYAARKELSPSK